MDALELASLFIDHGPQIFSADGDHVDVFVFFLGLGNHDRSPLVEWCHGRVEIFVEVGISIDSGVYQESAESVVIFEEHGRVPVSV